MLCAHNGTGRVCNEHILGLPWLRVSAPLDYSGDFTEQLPQPCEIIAEIHEKDRVLWLGGWYDDCIASQGFPLKGEGMLQEKLDYIRSKTPGFLEERAKKGGMTVQWSGFVPLSDREHLYGMSWAIYR